MTKDLSVLVNGDLLINSVQPEKDVLSLLMRFTAISGWKLWEGDAQTQLFVLKFITDKLKNEYPKVTLQMFESAIIEKIGTAYERSALSLFLMLDDWLIDHSESLLKAREPDKNTPKLVERTKEQKAIDIMNLVMSTYNLWKNGQKIMGGIYQVAEWLVENGYFEAESDLAVILYNNAKDQFLNDQKATKADGDFGERSRASAILDNWVERQNTKDVQGAILINYAELLVKHCFETIGDDLIEDIKASLKKN